MQKTITRAGALARLRALVPEREIFVRAGGTVRFLRITTHMQVMILSAIAMALGAWMVLTGAMLLHQMALNGEKAEIAAQRSAANSAAARASADRRSVDALARDLEQRQDALDTLMKTHFGSDVDQSRVIGKGGAAPARTMSSLSGTARLATIRERQQHFAAALGIAAKARLAEVEAAIRDVGLNPKQLAKGGQTQKQARGQGGPFIPAAKAVTIRGDRQLRSLASLLERLSVMESALGVLPSGRPTMAPMMTSSYGYRRDPFNGMAAFHAGIDFPGAYGQPILAASDGRISFVGQRSGYGNCIEVDHGHGIVTRYAHLSGFVARAGQRVERGQQIARMGSTGRSTGTHLHFEVRVNGGAVDPRPFLEARAPILEARQNARAPDASPRDRG